MKIVRAEETVSARQTHREGRIDLRGLIKGDPASSNNFEWSLVRMGQDYKTPRHRHNFSQIIMVLEGEHEWMPNQKRAQGTITYTSEGTYYGPQQGRGALLLTLQFGEASGSGFMSYEALDEGRKELAKRGSFAGGVYTWHDAEGRKYNSDSYEAIWEFVNGRPIAHPAPRYATPITVNPDAFRWTPSASEYGVHHKHLGTFSERGTAVEFIQYEPGARHRIHGLAAPELHFVLEGELRSSRDICPRWTALMFLPGDDETLDAIESTREYVIRLPDLRRIEPGRRDERRVPADALAVAGAKLTSLGDVLIPDRTDLFSSRRSHDGVRDP
jgi:hypothetical protein